MTCQDAPIGPGVATIFAMASGQPPDVPLVLWDERLTTGSAQRALIEAGIKRSKRKELVDKVAASVMLQSYLDCHKSPAAGQE